MRKTVVKMNNDFRIFLNFYKEEFYQFKKYGWIETVDKINEKMQIKITN